MLPSDPDQLEALGDLLQRAGAINHPLYERLVALGPERIETIVLVFDAFDRAGYWIDREEIADHVIALLGPPARVRTFGEIRDEVDEVGSGLWMKPRQLARRIRSVADAWRRKGYRVRSTEAERAWVAKLDELPGALSIDQARVQGIRVPGSEIKRPQTPDRGELAQSIRSIARGDWGAVKKSIKKNPGPGAPK